MYNVKVVADSRGPNGARLTTIEATYPLIIHNEIMTHRVLSKSVASNRAIGVMRMIESVIENPFIPHFWPKKATTMTANDYWPADSPEARTAKEAWLDGRDMAVQVARQMFNAGIHKQIVNRVLGPYLWTTAVITGTEWANFFELRCSPLAEPHMEKLAWMMLDRLAQSIPISVPVGWWHTPYVNGGFTDPTGAAVETIDGDQYIWPLIVSVGRCARVSYLNQGEDTTSAADDYTLGLKLRKDRHWVPYEHVAQARDKITPLVGWSGNFYGWGQLRKQFGDENTEFISPRLMEELQFRRANHGIDS